MLKTIIPLYDAEKINMKLDGETAILIESWNDQIEKMDFHGPVDEPDCVAIIDGTLSGDEAITLLRTNGINILPLIFEKVYYYNMVADENSIFQWFSTTYSVPRKGNSWIRANVLDEFLEKAVKAYKGHDLRFALDLHYEIDFRTSATEVQFVLLMLLLEHLSEKFVDASMDSPIPDEAKEKMLEIARKSMVSSGYMKDTDKPESYSKYNKLKGNLTSGLSTKSNKEMIFELLKDKCHLNVEKRFIGNIVDLRGDIVHGRKYSEDDLFKWFSKVEYMVRITLIVILTDFDPDFRKFIKVHGFPGFNILD